jgi:serine/threonine protein kinase
MIDANSEGPFLNLPDLKPVIQNKVIGTGSYGQVKEEKTALVNGELKIPIKSKAIKSFDISKNPGFFDHEVGIMEFLQSKDNPYIPHLYESTKEGNVGKIVMERIPNFSNRGITPDPEGNAVIDIALKLTDAISRTYEDGAVDIDPGIDSFKLEIDSNGHALKVRLVDIGGYFIRNGNSLKVLSGFVNAEMLSASPELLPIRGKENTVIEINAEKLAVHNLGFSLASIITPPQFWFKTINAYNSSGIFSRKEFEEDMIFTANQKNIPPLNLANPQITELLDLIENMLRVNPEDRPDFHEVYEKLNELKGDRKNVPVFSPTALKNMSKRGLFPDKTYVLNESQMEDNLAKLP